MARKKRAAGAGGPGASLLATRGGAGVVLNSPARLLHPPSVTTFGRAGSTTVQPSPAQVAAAAQANIAQMVSKDSLIRPPGPAFYSPEKAFHATHDKKPFHLNASSRWM